MSRCKLLQILGLSLALSAYSAWVLSVRPPRSDKGIDVAADEIALVRTAEAERLWKAPTTIFLDVRSAADYAYGHIAGALNVPEEEFEDLSPALKGRLQRAGAIVVYCKNVDCGKSLWAAIRLRNAGLAQTKIYPAGWYEWQERGLPSRRTAER